MGLLMEEEEETEAKLLLSWLAIGEAAAIVLIRAGLGKKTTLRERNWRICKSRTGESIARVMVEERKDTWRVLIGWMDSRILSLYPSGKKLGPIKRMRNQYDWFMWGSTSLGESSMPVWHFRIPVAVMLRHQRVRIRNPNWIELSSWYFNRPWPQAGSPIWYPGSSTDKSCQNQLDRLRFCWTAGSSDISMARANGFWHI